MKEEHVERAVQDGITLEYEEAGAGEPVVCIHGSFVADAFRPLLSERVLTDRYRLITFRRRGYGGSGPAGETSTVAEHARDCRRLLSFLGVQRAHVVGHSLGGLISLQLASDAPRLVHTLTLLEAALIAGESADQYRHGLLQTTQRYRDAGSDVAIDGFLQARWPGYREPLEEVLPGAFDQAVADAPTSFELDIPAVLNFSFGESEARRIAQPVLVARGEGSLALHPRFGETYRLLLSWLPNAEGAVVPDATHLLPLENPQALAEALVEFYARHRFVS